ncbi:Phosphoribulokinase / Uridine kinase family [Propionibacterium ruminifibrarum]|uniref:Phosphoribulokinase / Uridine kinase family n=1 Tax=Propionibacterium ruminifibrarum TaxID=1962131 RepID=A0A375I592_9ACTN|nr:nucleoside/nucleotide kinase family protein [Propionibacterium ruminifibrarum]SPF68418.1 Phosphoribulokinase / Uridine kinase family [Propionibacterium ruminifibrarum]
MGGLTGSSVPATVPAGDAPARAAGLARDGRRLLGIAGEPGSGKSTLAASLQDFLGGAAVVVPMDGFHLAQQQLERLGLAERKGAPDTMDAWGFLALVRRLKAADEPTVWAPEYRRELHNGVTGAIEVPASVPLVILEGNYLLLDTEPWARIRAHLDESWFVSLDAAVRLERLVARHIATGKSPDAAAAWANGPDEENARVIRESAKNADVIVEGR